MAPAVLATLLTGFAMGLFRLIVDTPVKLGGTAYTEGSFLWIVNNIFFQYYSLLITIVCIIVFLVVSYATKPPDYAKISGLTFSTLTPQDRLEQPSKLECERCDSFNIVDRSDHCDLYVFYWII